MSTAADIGEQRGADTIEESGWSARLLRERPLIAPARQFVFPVAVPGEEEAMDRGSVWVEVRASAGGTFLAQCALGFRGAQVAHGLWASPVAGGLVAVAGGYAYSIPVYAPDRTTLLPLRPVVRVLRVLETGRLVLAGFHGVAVVEQDGAVWMSPRLSWEGLALLACDGRVLQGTGWDMQTDEDVSFALDLEKRAAQGGGFR